PARRHDVRAAPSGEEANGGFGRGEREDRPREGGGGGGEKDDRRALGDARPRRAKAVEAGRRRDGEREERQEDEFFRIADPRERGKRAAKETQDGGVRAEREKKSRGAEKEPRPETPAGASENGRGERRGEEAGV